MTRFRYRRNHIVLLLAVWALAPGFHNATSAGDWPQILGPGRNGKAEGETLLDRWPKAGPEIVWQRPVGQGFAGVAVAGGRAVLFHRMGDESLVEALDAASGKPFWQAAYPTSYASQISSDSGPRCVPVIHKGFVYALGAGGDLHCLALDSGKKIWSRDLRESFAAGEGYFGTGSSPIVAGDKLLINVGGKEAGLVAFTLSDGKTVWKATSEEASYSSPVAATIKGVPQVIFVTRYHALAINPDTGKVLFRLPFGMRGPTVNAASPLVLGDKLFLSASYGVGAKLVSLGSAESEPLWESDDVMSSQYTTCVERQGLLYGIDGRQDVGVARLRAIEPTKPKVLWTQEGFGTGNLILAGDKLLIMKTSGELVLAEASPERYRPLASAQVLSTTVQALPALANGLLYARDTETLKCLRVGRSVAKD